MTKTERIAYIKRQIPDCGLTDEAIGDKISEAEAAILERRYPYGTPASFSGLPSRYEKDLLRLSVRYVNRMGAEGEVSHNENGVNRTYERPDDFDILGKIMPIAKLI